MYLPTHFAETRPEMLGELMRAHPLAALVVSGPDGLEANHIPLEWDPAPAPFGTLRGHLARANGLWRLAGQGAPALAIFQGPAAYVSPDWYSAKREHGKVVPTWNYVVVHAHGTLRAIDDRAWLHALVTRLTNRHESARATPWQVTDAPADYIDKMLQAIIGLELPIARLEGKWKLGQNRGEADREAVAQGLLAEAGDAAAEMARLVRRAASD